MPDPPEWTVKLYGVEDKVWDVTFTKVTEKEFMLIADGQREITLSVTCPKGARYGDRLNVVVNAISKGDPGAFDAKTLSFSARQAILAATASASSRKRKRSRPQVGASARSIGPGAIGQCPKRLCRNAHCDTPGGRSIVEKLQVLVDGGKATPGPPLGPALGPLGVNIVEILKAINEKTKSFDGMKVPVTLLVDPKTKTFSIEVGTPPTSALITKELKIKKGSGDPGKTRVGNLSLPQAIRIANMKADATLAKTLKARVLEVVGTCVSMGVTVEGKLAKDLSKDIQSGKFDKQLAG